jgi:hypothetical protein
MSCCGRQRAMMIAHERAGDEDESAPVWFLYAGVRTIVVKGGATGHVYRFAPGHMLRVHGDDASSMREIPGLRPRDLT